MTNKRSFTKKKKSAHSIIHLYELLDQVNLIQWENNRKKKWLTLGVETGKRHKVNFWGNANILIGVCTIQVYTFVKT